VARRAFVLGGTGNVGGAIAQSLLADGWEVTLASRESPAPPSLESLPLVHLDREQPGALSGAAGSDLLVDVVPFELAHAEQLLSVEVGAIVAISSASVYADAAGRTLDEAQSADEFPDFGGPVAETQPTVAPGDATYSTKKVALEQRLLENSHVPATIVRPCAIYGRGDRMGREWFFVKRALDRRPYVILTMRGASLFHTTSSANIGELVRRVAAAPRTDVFNCGDPDPPTALEISRRIAAAVGREWAEVLLPAAAGRGAVGGTPWSVPRPFLVDMSRAVLELGYEPATTWSDAIESQVAWLVEASRDGDWRDVLTRGAEYLQFDYGSEDALVAELPETVAKSVSTPPAEPRAPSP
jgi:nucleoside-diphosphate-sugar epimerase